ncbi:MAG: GDSL-type esterase/lipase family protein [Anaeromyxobacteraceae bacterium]
MVETSCAAVLDRERSLAWLVATVMLAAPLGCTVPPPQGGTAAAAAPASAAGLVAGYAFTEAAGTTTADASGNGVTGRLSGATWTAGHAGGGLSFDGSTSYVDLGSPAALALTGSLTVSAWVNEGANVGDDGIIVAKSSGAGGWELKSSPDTGQRTFALGIYTTTGAYVARYSNAARALGTWYHVAGVYDATARTLHVFVNGALADGTLVGTVPSAIANPAVNAFVGKRPAGFHLRGVVDDVRVYGRALTQAEIQADLAAAVDAGTGDVTPPTVPTGLTASPASATRVDLAWSASTDDTGVAGYRVYRGGALVGSTAGTTYADVTVAGGTTYAYAVAAYDLSGNASATSAACPVTTPAAPFDFSLSGPGGRSVGQGGTVSGTVAASLASGAPQPVTFTASGLPAGASATFTPAACTPPCSTTLSITAGASTPTGTSTATITGVAGGLLRTSTFALTVTGAVDDQAPAGTVVVNGGAPATRSTAVTLTLAASDAQGAVAQMRFSNTGTSWSTAQAYATTKAWTLASGSGTKTVYAQFSDAAGNWSPSASDTIVLDTTAPTISGVSATGILATSATLAWTTNEPATSQVEYGPTTSYGLLTPLDPSLVASHRLVLTGLKASTTCYYRVRSMDAAGNEKLSSRSSFKTTSAPDTAPPSVPSGLTATGTSVSRVSLAWTASTDNVAVAGYRVYRDGTQVATTAATTFVDTALAPATTHVYGVAAYDGAGNLSAVSGPVPGTTLPDGTAPSVPASLRAMAVTAHRVDLAWAASTDDVGVDGYEVSRDGTLLAVVTGPAFSDADLPPLSTHGYSVAARDAAGNVSARSAPLSVTTLDVVTVTPAEATTATGQPVALACTVDDPVDASCTWTVLEGDAGGRVTATGPATGRYAPPSTTGTFHVVATSSAEPDRSATVTIRVLDGNVFAAPMPLVSRFPGVQAYASNDAAGTLGDFGANRARDGVYDGWGHAWRPIDAGYPQWLAYDLSSVPAGQRGTVLVAFYNETFGYDDGPASTTPLAYSVPAEYVLEANPAPGGTGVAPSDGWEPLVSVTGNRWHSRTHALDLTGFTWLRFRAVSGMSTNQPGNRDVELKLEVFDAHLGNTDSWLFVGDSITATGMSHLEHGGQNFSQRVNAAAPANYPLYENAGQPFDTAQVEGPARLAVALANSPAKYVALAYGTNDGGAGLPADDAFYVAYRALVETVLAAGRIPVVPTIPWTAEEPWRTAIGDPVTGPELGLNRQLARLKADLRAEGKVVLDGPDLWHLFEANPALMGTHDVHPTDAGYVEMRHLWADTLLGACYGR